MLDKIGGCLMVLLGSLLAIYTVIDSLDGVFTHVSRMDGVYQSAIENGVFDFYFSLVIQVGIGMMVLALGVYIIRLSKV